MVVLLYIGEWEKVVYLGTELLLWAFKSEEEWSTRLCEVRVEKWTVG